MLKLALIGCGALGTEVIKSIKSGILRYRVVGLLDKKYDYAKRLAELLGNLELAVKDLDELLRREPDIVVETASPIAVKQYAEEILRRGKTLVVMSSGALLDEEFFKKIEELLRKFGGRIVVPSGAIGGVDIIKAISRLRDVDVRLITIKSAHSYRDEYLQRVGVRREDIKGRTLLFSGPASKAIQYFPTMINVAATISLALGKIVDVEIYADPEVEETTHRIIIRSSAVNADVELINKHHPQNPRTSYLAALSLIKTLEELQENRITIGT